MGTNYYLRSKPCPHCGGYEMPLHIGKKSAGWVFMLHIDPDENINSLKDWIRLWNQPDVQIIDEYNEVITPEEMLNIINDDEEGLLRHKEADYSKENYDITRDTFS